MHLLAFETATEACSVALYVDGEVRERFALAPRQHAELALPWADALLAEAGLTKARLDAVAVGRGPGAFTGVRLGVAIAQGIALALDRPLLPISTLAALAFGVGSGAADADADADTSNDIAANILAAIDARMGEIYVGSFRRSGGDLVALGDEAVVAPERFVAPEGDDWHGVGTGFAAADGLLRRRLQGRLRSVDAAALPHAADVARLAAAAYARGEGLAPERVEPAYLRNDVALTLAQQQARRDSNAS